MNHKTIAIPFKLDTNVFGQITNTGWDKIVQQFPVLRNLKDTKSSRFIKTLLESLNYLLANQYTYFNRIDASALANGKNHIILKQFNSLRELALAQIKTPRDKIFFQLLLITSLYSEIKLGSRGDFNCNELAGLEFTRRGFSIEDTGLARILLENKSYISKLFRGEAGSNICKTMEFKLNQIKEEHDNSWEKLVLLSALIMNAHKGGFLTFEMMNDLDTIKNYKSFNVLIDNWDTARFDFFKPVDKKKQINESLVHGTAYINLENFYPIATKLKWEEIMGVLNLAKKILNGIETCNPKSIEFDLVDEKEGISFLKQLLKEELILNNTNFNSGKINGYNYVLTQNGELIINL